MIRAVRSQEKRGRVKPGSYEGWKLCR